MRRAGPLLEFWLLETSEW